MIPLFKEENLNPTIHIYINNIGSIGLPNNDFLHQRRKRMSLVIKDAFLKLKR